MGWTLDDIHWAAFDRNKVDPDHVKLVKAAALVEQNAFDYAHYLRRVFADNPDFAALSESWAAEEVQHGQVLARYATLVDPGWDFATALDRFNAHYQANAGAEQSVRGSRSGELIARCIVETGTSSYYTALKDRTADPVLAEICQRIAADEFRHYKLFYTHLKHYLDSEKLSRWQRFRIAFGRMSEAEDDELACAYWAANGEVDEPYHRGQAARAYAKRAYSIYRAHHIDRLVAMSLKAAGIEPRGSVQKLLSFAGWHFLRKRVRKLDQLAA